MHAPARISQNHSITWKKGNSKPTTPICQYNPHYSKHLMYILNDKKKKKNRYIWQPQKKLIWPQIQHYQHKADWAAALMTHFETNRSNDKQSIYNYFLQPQLLSDLLLSTEMLESSVERTWGIDIPPETTISAIEE